MIEPAEAMRCEAAYVSEVAGLIGAGAAIAAEVMPAKTIESAVRRRVIFFMEFASDYIKIRKRFREKTE